MNYHQNGLKNLFLEYKKPDFKEQNVTLLVIENTQQKHFALH